MVSLQAKPPAESAPARRVMGKRAAQRISIASLERRLGELVVRAAQAQDALHRARLDRVVANRQERQLHLAVAEIVGTFDAMVGDINQRLIALSDMLQSLRSKR